MIKRLFLLFIVAFSISALSCNNSPQANTNRNNPLEPPPFTANAKPQPDAEVAVIEFEDAAYGQIVLELYSNIAPKMVARFKELAQAGFYNGTAIHRIDPNLGIIQGGDPLSKDNDPANDGTGDSGKPNVPGEFTDVPFDAGIIGAARATNPDSANSQFFIMTKRQAAFDKRYTVFGKVVEGLNNARTIAGEPTLPGTDKPDLKIVIKSVTIRPR